MSPPSFNAFSVLFGDVQRESVYVMGVWTLPRLFLIILSTNNNCSVLICSDVAQGCVYMLNVVNYNGDMWRAKSIAFSSLRTWFFCTCMDVFTMTSCAPERKVACCLLTCVLAPFVDYSLSLNYSSNVTNRTKLEQLKLTETKDIKE